MVDKNNYVPVQAINSYVWKLLQDKRGWDKANYGGKMPIIPGSRQPEFANYPSPYITYGYSEETGTDDWYIVRSTLAYTIYGANDEVVNNTVSFLANALRRKDDAAMDINLWVHSDENASKDVFSDVSFLYTEITNTQGTGPEATEGGAVDGLVVIRFAYAVDYPATAFRI